MKASERDLALKSLYDAFSSVEKPEPLASFEGSYCDEEVEVFNRLDWESATYSEFLSAQEGAIICGASARLYLLPRLFRMVLLRRHGTTNGAVDNLSSQLETWPLEEDVQSLLTIEQKHAIIRAWRYLDTTLYSPSGSTVARELAVHWNLD